MNTKAPDEEKFWWMDAKFWNVMDHAVIHDKKVHVEEVRLPLIDLIVAESSSRGYAKGFSDAIQEAIGVVEKRIPEHEMFKHGGDLPQPEYALTAMQEDEEILVLLRALKSPKPKGQE